MLMYTGTSAFRPPEHAARNSSAGPTWWRTQIDYMAAPVPSNAHKTDAFIGSPSLVQTGLWHAGTLAR